MQPNVSALMLLVGTLAFSGCQTGPITKISHVTGDLRGMLYDLDRQPVSEAAVTVSFGDRTVTVQTDLHGRFAMGAVPYGPIVLDASKSGFEALKWEFQYVEGSEVLYLQTASTDQLVEKAASALERKQWQDFQGYLDRARRIDPKNLQILILDAMWLGQQGRIDEAVILLGSNEPGQPILAVELLLGDLFERKGDRSSALIHWRKALEIREDANLRAKIDKLQP